MDCNDTNKIVISVVSTSYNYLKYYYLNVNLTLSYIGNQLKKVSDQCAALTYEGAMDFRDGVDKATEYQWDANGNLTRDRNKGIHTVCYNVLNLPQEILFGDSHIIRYKYAADGRKLQTEYVVSPVTVLWDDIEPGGPLDPIDGRARVRNRDGIGGGEYFPVETTLMMRDYCGDVIYRDGQLERIMSEYGYWAGGQWHYHIRDYQGNVRAVIDHAGTLLETNSYYPYGGLQGGGTAGVQPYKYGGKELDRQRGLDWYDSQARMYAPLIGRTPTQDPLLEKYYPISPYAWCAGNPILFKDEIGKEIVVSVNPNDRRTSSVLLAASTYRDDDAINIYAHGSPNSILTYDKETRKDVILKTSNDFKSFLSENSTLWQNRKGKERITIVLHSCETGKGENSFAQQMSAELDNVTIIAPNENISVLKNGHEIVQNKQEDSHGTRQVGKWIEFENGKKSAESPGHLHPNRSKFEKILDFFFNNF